MAEQELLSIRESKWHNSLPALRNKYYSAMKAGESYTLLLLDFANDYYTAWTEAKRIVGTRQQQTARVMLLNKSIGVDKHSPAWISNLRVIGKESAWMRKLGAHLPRATDSLKCLAVAGRGKSVSLIRAGDVGTLSTLTETRRALAATPRHYVKQRQTYDGSLTFFSRADALRVFANALVTTNGELKVSDKGLFSALQAHLGKQRWKNVKSRVKV